MSKTRVIHPSFGVGTVIGSRVARRVLQVIFDSGKTKLLPKHCLTIINANASSVENVRIFPQEFSLAKYVRPSSLYEGRYSDSRRLVEALRLGIVPKKDIREFTHVPSYLQENLDGIWAALKKPEGVFSILNGAYGFGKTHLLTYIREEALSLGWAVANVDLDSTEVRACNPKRAWREITRSLEWGPKQAGFRDLLKCIAFDDSARREFSSHVIFSAALQYIVESGDDCEANIFWDWIEGEDVRMPSVRDLSPNLRKSSWLPDHATRADLYCYMITALSRMLEHQGCKGLFITFDEGESLRSLKSKFQERADNFLKGLCWNSLGSDAIRFSEDDLQHGGHGNIPFNFGNAPLSIVLATTPQIDTENDDFFASWSLDVRMLELGTMKKDGMKRLLELLVLRYREAWTEGQSSSDANIDAELLWQKFAANYEDGTTNLRLCLKSCVEILDVCRHHKLDLRSLADDA